MVPEEVSLKAGMVVGRVNWLILIAGRVGITIVLPVEQSAAVTIVSKKLVNCGGTEE